MATYYAKLAPLFVQTQTFWDGDVSTNKPCAMTYAAVFDDSCNAIMFGTDGQLLPVTPLVSTDYTFSDVKSRVESALAGMLPTWTSFAAGTDTLQCDWLSNSA